ncbi:uncharacterized protein MONOS_6538 [Monocercomonoides exilis]|uniref:uncharacterized protein n=1 Tax=Monocercomonoides exilis TaxID=2049356 RepID=UPI003559B732|nr:hypothetical protein MONOS_6538 [Monocercomonoides exilis]|eukprot:MONOS_6538.1-p1 / transcript=MONOS_6538.1 / gene=MONOS_6538 / organism=Monocercomonoides_exilis_PA203 / gene_product=unspecified product / transcript_product=unspecified product / location=Mono_scaffold00207:49663-53448(+) / protein_length=1138 / sequence_SO=supercontig / SO=protein_coding / is_pseudo=false
MEPFWDHNTRATERFKSFNNEDEIIGVGKFQFRKAKSQKDRSRVAALNKFRKTAQLNDNEENASNHKQLVEKYLCDIKTGDPVMMLQGVTNIRKLLCKVDVDREANDACLTFDALSVFAELLLLKDEDTLYQTLWCLNNITSLETNYTRAVAYSKCFERIVALAYSPNEQIRILVIWCLVNIVSDSPDLVEWFMAQGADRPVLNIFWEIVQQEPYLAEIFSEIVSKLEKPPSQILPFPQSALSSSSTSAFQSTSSFPSSSNSFISNPLPSNPFQSSPPPLLSYLLTVGSRRPSLITPNSSSPSLSSESTFQQLPTLNISCDSDTELSLLKRVSTILNWCSKTLSDKILEERNKHLKQQKQKDKNVASVPINGGVTQSQAPFPSASFPVSPLGAAKDDDLSGVTDDEIEAALQSVEMDNGTIRIIGSSETSSSNSSSASSSVPSSSSSSSSSFTSSSQPQLQTSPLQCPIFPSQAAEYFAVGQVMMQIVVIGAVREQDVKCLLETGNVTEVDEDRWIEAKTAELVEEMKKERESKGNSSNGSSNIMQYAEGMVAMDDVSQMSTETFISQAEIDEARRRSSKMWIQKRRNETALTKRYCELLMSEVRSILKTSLDFIAELSMDDDPTILEPLVVLNRVPLLVSFLSFSDQFLVTDVVDIIRALTLDSECCSLVVKSEGIHYLHRVCYPTANSIQTMLARQRRKKRKGNKKKSQESSPGSRSEALIQLRREQNDELNESESSSEYESSDDYVSNLERSLEKDEGADSFESRIDGIHHLSTPSTPESVLSSALEALGNIAANSCEDCDLVVADGVAATAVECLADSRHKVRQTALFLLKNMAVGSLKHIKVLIECSVHIWIARMWVASSRADQLSMLHILLWMMRGGRLMAKLNLLELTDIVDDEDDNDYMHDEDSLRTKDESGMVIDGASYGKGVGDAIPKKRWNFKDSGEEHQRDEMQFLVKYFSLISDSDYVEVNGPKKSITEIFLNIDKFAIKNDSFTDYDNVVLNQLGDSTAMFEYIADAMKNSSSPKVKGAAKHIWNSFIQPYQIAQESGMDDGAYNTIHIDPETPFQIMNSFEANYISSGNEMSGSANLLAQKSLEEEMEMKKAQEAAEAMLNEYAADNANDDPDLLQYQMDIE